MQGSMDRPLTGFSGDPRRKHPIADEGEQTGVRKRKDVIPDPAKLEALVGNVLPGLRETEQEGRAHLPEGMSVEQAGGALLQAMGDRSNLSTLRIPRGVDRNAEAKALAQAHAAEVERLREERLAFLEAAEGAAQLLEEVGAKLARMQAQKVTPQTWNAHQRALLEAQQEADLAGATLNEAIRTAQQKAHEASLDHERLHQLRADNVATDELVTVFNAKKLDERPIPQEDQVALTKLRLEIAGVQTVSAHERAGMHEGTPLTPAQREELAAGKLRREEERRKKKANTASEA